MSIEVNMSSAPQAADKTEITRKTAKGNAADSEGASTFLSLLTSMEPDTGMQPTAPAQDLLVQGGNTALLTPDLTDAGALLSQCAGWVAAAPETLDVAALSPGALAGVPLALPNAKAAGADATTLAAASGVGARGAGKPAGKVTSAATGVNPTPGLAEAAAALQAGATQHAAAGQTAQASLHRAEAERLSQSSQSAASTMSAEVPAGKAHIAADEAKADWRSNLAMQGGANSVASAALGEIGAWAKGSGNVPRSGDRAVPRPSFVPAGAALAGSWTQQAMTDATAVNPTSYSPDLSSSSPDTAVAEKLNYWISRGVQNAELKLDAFGGGTVQVNIAMSGLDAQVEFRSDQPEARRLLTDAMPQLRDMLKNEGLSLSGGFVGTSAQSDPGSQEQRSQAQSARIFRAAAEPAPMGRTSPVNRMPGRTVDLFV